MKTLIAVTETCAAAVSRRLAAAGACPQASHARFARRLLVTVAVAGVALCLSTAAAAVAAAAQGTSSPPGSGNWHGGWGSETGWWGPGWWGQDKFVDVLPWNYQSFWWKGMPYYYGGAAFYAWNGDVGKYEEVTPPIGFNQPLSGYVAMSDGIPKLSTKLFAYPSGGQSQAQQASDMAECHKLAAPPPAPAATAAPAAATRGPPAARRPPPGAGPRAAGAPPAGANARAGRPGRRRARPSPPIETGPPPDTLSMQQSAMQAEATCLEKRHYSVR